MLQAVHGWSSTYERLVNSQNFFSSYLTQEDHSRLGRKSVWWWASCWKETFAQYHVRYIAINDGVDTINGIDDSIAVRDLFNEWHARDTSKKVKAVIMASARRGERIGTSAPYGYKKGRGEPQAPGPG